MTSLYLYCTEERSWYNSLSIKSNFQFDTKTQHYKKSIVSVKAIVGCQRYLALYIMCFKARLQLPPKSSRAKHI